MSCDGVGDEEGSLPVWSKGPVRRTWSVERAR